MANLDEIEIASSNLKSPSVAFEAFLDELAGAGAQARLRPRLSAHSAAIAPEIGTCTPLQPIGPGPVHQPSRPNQSLPIPTLEGRVHSHGRNGVRGGSCLVDFRSYLLACYQKPTVFSPPESGPGEGLPEILVFPHIRGTSPCQVPPRQ